VHCVGAPITMPDGQVNAAVSIATTTVSLSRQQLLDLVPLLLETTSEIERELA
jgi:DNA-binding IclR family transcriptional regulator